MRQFFLVVICLILPQAPANSADDRTDWAVRMMRVDGAAVGVRRAAEKVEETAKKISSSGNLHRLGRLKMELEELDRMVMSTRLAVNVAAEKIDRP